MRRCLTSRMSAGLWAVVLLLPLGCASGQLDRDRAWHGPQQASQAAPADDFLARQAADMAAEDQRRSAEAMSQSKPRVPYRDNPLPPIRRR